MSPLFELNGTDFGAGMFNAHCLRAIEPAGRNPLHTRAEVRSSNNAKRSSFDFIRFHSTQSLAYWLTSSQAYIKKFFIKNGISYGLNNRPIHIGHNLGIKFKVQILVDNIRSSLHVFMLPIVCGTR